MPLKAAGGIGLNGMIAMWWDAHRSCQSGPEKRGCKNGYVQIFCPSQNKTSMNCMGLRFGGLGL